MVRFFYVWYKKKKTFSCIITESIILDNMTQKMLRLAYFGLCVCVCMFLVCVQNDKKIPKRMMTNFLVVNAFIMEVSPWEFYNCCFILFFFCSNLPASQPTSSTEYLHRHQHIMYKQEMMVTKTFMVHLKLCISGRDTQTSPKKFMVFKQTLVPAKPAYMKYKMQKYDRFCLAASIQVCIRIFFFVCVYLLFGSHIDKIHALVTHKASKSKIARVSFF